MRWNWFHTVAEQKVSVKGDVCKMIPCNLFFCCLTKCYVRGVVYYVSGDGVLDFLTEEGQGSLRAICERSTRTQFSWKRFQEKPRFAK